MKKLFFGIVSLSLMLTACQKDDSLKSKTYLGAASNFQHGKAWTWMETDKNEIPLQIGIAIDDAAMASLDRGHSSEGGHTHTNGVNLAVHPKVSAITPIQYVQLDWNPHGHEPEPIYGLPHFDFHYYNSSPAETNAIPPYDVDPSGFENVPAAEYFPANYINPGGGVPKMGKHWLDITSPELSGAKFTQTLIYGSYNGKVTFVEPMITEECLRASSGFSRPVPQPAKVQKTGYYATEMQIKKSAGFTSVILSKFVYRQAS